MGTVTRLPVNPDPVTPFPPVPPSWLRSWFAARGVDDAQFDAMLAARYALSASESAGRAAILEAARS